MAVNGTETAPGLTATSEIDRNPQLFAWVVCMLGVMIEMVELSVIYRIIGDLRKVKKGTYQPRKRHAEREGFLYAPRFDPDAPEPGHKAYLPGGMDGETLPRRI